jgi:endoglucanase
VVEVIRSVDTEHTIIIGGANWNSYTSLAAMPEYTDDKLIYTFHFYDPFLFSHQGASWVQPSMVPLAGIPFPYSAQDMPPLPPSLAGSWVGNAYNGYANDGTVARVQELLDIAIAFREQRKVPIFLGELGILMNNSDPEDRVYWYQVVREYLDANDISWTSWDYHGGFGLFNQGSPGKYEHDLIVPLLQALGFALPQQTAASTTSECSGFVFYADATAGDFAQSSFSSGALDMASGEHPHDGNACIRWANAGQYQNVGFDFQPDRDLSFRQQQ